MELMLLVLVLYAAAVLWLAGGTHPAAQWNSEGVRDHESTSISPWRLWWPRVPTHPPRDVRLPNFIFSVMLKAPGVELGAFGIPLGAHHSDHA